MSKLYKENGDISPYGDDTFSTYLDKEVKVLLNDATSENELRLIGSLIQKRVGDIVSNAIQTKNKVNPFKSLSDEQFRDYLKGKYGDRYSFVSLTPDEYDRVPRISEEKIRAALEQGRKEREAFEEAQPMISPGKGLRFK